MSIDKSLKKRGALARARNVMKRDERITRLIEQDRWQEGQSPFGLPKVRVYRMVVRKAKKKEKAEGAEGAEAAAAAAPAKTAGKPAAKTPAKPAAKAPPKK